MGRLTLGLVLGLVSMAWTNYAQAQTSPTDEQAQFDFWVGEWKLTWTTQAGVTQNGSNNVKKILDGKVIQENFDGGDKLPLKGISHSVFNVKSRKWQQTWVDNSGGYLDFTGGMKDDQMILQRQVTVDDQLALQRMRFYNIRKDSIDWDWEASSDGGKTWALQWRIKYQRQAEDE